MSAVNEVYGYCPPWCVAHDYEGTTDHPSIHSGLFGGPAQISQGVSATVFVQPVADTCAAFPWIRQPRNPRIVFALGDEPPPLAVTSATARWVTAGLVRMADHLETGAALTD
jgi:hypothetical protein